MTSTLCLAGLAQAAHTAAHAAPHHATNGAASGGARAIYRQLAQAGDAAAQRATARAWLASQLDAAAGMPCDFPADPADAFAWIQGNTDRVGMAYQHYLMERRAGAPRRYFSNK